MTTSNVTIKDKQVKKLLSDMIKAKGKISQRSKDYVTLIGARVIADIIDHFENEQGPNGRWAPWSEAYRLQMAKKGKAGNKILQDTGRLKGGWMPARYRKSKQGVLWFNPVKYAGAHDQGTNRLPKRQFTWLSSKAMSNISEDTVKFMLMKR